MVSRRSVVVAGRAMVAALVLTHAAHAEQVVLGGLTFSDELPGIEILDGWGSGTLEDPFVVVERITGVGPATLIVRGMSWRFGNRIRSHHEVGFALTKIVHNRTELPWPIFNLELREHRDEASPFGDGLSFGQATDAGRPFLSDRFAAARDVQEPYDGLSFYEGMIEPGEVVSLSFVVTDTTPKYEFYLLQRRDSPLARAPSPIEALTLVAVRTPLGIEAPDPKVRRRSHQR